MRRLRSAVAALALVTGPAWAGGPAILPCDDLASVLNVAEPWEASHKNFDGGAVQSILINTGYEPTCCSFRLAVIIPNPDPEIGGRQCWMIVADGDTRTGWFDIVFHEMVSGFDPSFGLILQVPAYTYDPATGVNQPQNRQLLSVAINRETGAVTLYIQ